MGRSKRPDYLYLQPREVRRAVRKRGGLGYRDVEARPNGLFVGNACVVPAERVEDAARVAEFGSLPVPSSPDGPLGYVPPRNRLHRCGCGAWFVAHHSARACLTCRRAETLAKVRGYTAERSAERAGRRAAQERACERCGEPMPFARTTKRYCSDACRQAAHRAR